MDYKEIVTDKAKVGGFNDFPPNMREITQKEFCQSLFFVYEPIYTEYRQVTEQKKGILKKQDFSDLKIYWFHDGSYIALNSDYWEGKLRFFRGEICKHDVRVEYIGNCLRRETCKLCGFTEDIDSSD